MESLDQWHQQGDYFQCGEHRIFFRTDGDETKPVMLLIHGFPTCSWDWAKVWDDLKQHFYLVTLDMLGFGYSDKPQQVYSIFQQADIYLALLDKLNISQFHILAHDYGDTVAQELLARLDGFDRIQSVVFGNGGLFPETHQPVLVQKILLSSIGGLFAKLISFKSFKRNLDHICAKKLSEEELKNYWSMLEHKNGLAVMHRLVHYMRERRAYRHRWVAIIEKAQTPLHLVDGTLDPISGENMVKRYEELIPNASVVRLQDTGHYPQVESPKAFYQSCLPFWQKLGIPLYK